MGSLQPWGEWQMAEGGRRGGDVFRSIPRGIFNGQRLSAREDCRSYNKLDLIVNVATVIGDHPDQPSALH